MNLKTFLLTVLFSWIFVTVSLAVENAPKIIDSDNKKAVEHNRLGLEFWEQGDYEKALKEFQAVSKLEPMTESSHFNEKLAHQKLGNHVEAEKHSRYIEMLKNNNVTGTYEPYTLHNKLKWAGLAFVEPEKAINVEIVNLYEKNEKNLAKFKSWDTSKYSKVKVVFHSNSGNYDAINVKEYILLLELYPDDPQQVFVQVINQPHVKGIISEEKFPGLESSERLIDWKIKK